MSINTILRPSLFGAPENTTGLETTNEVVGPTLKGIWLVASSDFDVADSPEQAELGNKNFPIDKAATTISGSNARHGLQQVGKRLYEEKNTLMSLAYKKHQRPRGESPAIRIIEEFANPGADLRVYDPFVSSPATKIRMFVSTRSVEEGLSRAECATFLANHDVFQGNSGEAMKELMTSPGITDGKNPLAGKERVV